jgi:hypothetical protein
LRKIAWFLGFIALLIILIYSFSTNINQKFEMTEIGILFLVGLFLAHPPISSQKVELGKRTLLQELERKNIFLYVTFINFSVILFFMSYLYMYESFENWQSIGYLSFFLIGLLISLQLIHLLGKVVRSKKVILLLFTLLSLSIAFGILVFDVFLFVIYLLIILHWYGYNFKETSKENIKNNLIIFMTSFCQTGFLLLLVRKIEEMYRISYGLPLENSVSYLILSIGFTMVIFYHFKETKRMLKYYYGVISETQFFLALYPLFVFDARFSKKQRILRKLIFLVGITIMITILLFLLYRINDFLVI